MALQKGRGARYANEAVDALAVAVPYELGVSYFTLYPAYVRGGAYLAAHQGPVNHPSVVLNDVIGALAHLQLGRAYVLAGDTAKAKAAYQDFLTLWKDADQDVPVLKQAKAENAKLLASNPAHIAASLSASRHRE
jgi:eukaryotic-like serine/threonine-protein kinase